MISRFEEKPGNISNTQLVRGIIIDKTIDSSSMPKMIKMLRLCSSTMSSKAKEQEVKQRFK